MARARQQGDRRSAFLLTLVLAATLCLAGCGGDEAQATAVILANSAGTTATAVARSVNATTTAALGQVPSVGIPSSLPGASGVPSLPSALPSAPSASAASLPPIVATLIPSGAPTPGGSRPTIVLPTAQASGSGPGGTLLPAGFPLPSGYTLVSNLESGGQIIVVLGVSSSKDAYDFYKGALPGAGYQVTDQGGTTVPTGGFIGTLTVSNASYDGTIAFTPGGPSGQTVTIQLSRK
jgi:hypothetical protein